MDASRPVWSACADSGALASLGTRNWWMCKDSTMDYLRPARAESPHLNLPCFQHPPMLRTTAERNESLCTEQRQHTIHIGFFFASAAVHQPRARSLTMHRVCTGPEAPDEKAAAAAVDASPTNGPWNRPDEGGEIAA